MVPTNIVDFLTNDAENPRAVLLAQMEKLERER